MAYKGKATCRILKDIRRQIAETNDIDLVIKECTYQGDCAGTCPRCEAEVAYLEQELARRKAMGKIIQVTGLAAATFAATACSLKPKQSTPVPEEDMLLTGDVAEEIVDNSAVQEPEEDAQWMAGGKPLTKEDLAPIKTPVTEECIIEGDSETIMGLEPYPLIEEGGIEEDSVFAIAETMPSFPGGTDSLFQFLAANVNYPSEIQGEAHIECRVIVQFTVSKTGEIADVEVVRSSGYEAFDKEAVRVTKSMPNWNPGRQRGKAVNVRYTIPFNFRLVD